MGRLTSKISGCFSAITLEPVYFLMALGSSFDSLASGELTIMKVCGVNYGYDDTICGNLSAYKDTEQVLVQQTVTQINMYSK